MTDEILYNLQTSIKEVCDFKCTHPYNHLEWSTRKDDQVGNTAKCRALLDCVVGCLKVALKDAGVPYGSIKVSEGASYFPRQPWVGLFYKDEKPSNGVYPIISFAEDGQGCWVGCAESLTINQPHFSERFCTDKTIDTQYGQLAKGAKWFPKDAIDALRLVETIRLARSIWERYREEHSLVVYSIKPTAYEADMKARLRAWLINWFGLLDLREGDVSGAADYTTWWNIEGRNLARKELGLDNSSISELFQIPVDDWLEHAASETIQSYARRRVQDEKWRSQKAIRELDEEWYECIEVQDVYSWLKRLSSMQEKETDRLWVFRGQGDSVWKLESGLGLKVKYDENPNVDVDSVLAYEHETMSSFKRELAKMPEYSRFDGVDVLALMQHYGTKTRLLDFSLSPLVALYMALDQRDTYVSQALLYNNSHGDGAKEFDSRVVVWMMDVKQFAYPGFDLSLNAGMGTGSGNGVARQMPWWEAKEVFRRDANAILEASNRQPMRAGIDVVFPSMNSARISSQEGLFLMPRRMDCSFHTNLKSATINAKQCGCKFLAPVKFVFAAGAHNVLRKQLQDLYVTSKMIYPDLIGLAQSLNSKADFKNR